MEMDVNKRTRILGWKFFKRDNGIECLRNDKLNVTMEGYSVGDFEEDGLARIQKDKFSYFAELFDKDGKIQDYVTSSFFNFHEGPFRLKNEVPYTRKVFDAKNPQVNKPKYRDVCGVVFDRNDGDFVRKCEVAKRMALYLLGKDEDGKEGLTLEDLTKPMGKLEEGFYGCFKDGTHVKAILQHEKMMLIQWAEEIKAKSEKATTFEDKKSLTEEKEKWNQRKAFVDAFVRDACEKTLSAINNEFESESNEMNF